MWSDRICSDVGFFGRCCHFIVNEILNLMTQSKALISIMTMLLVKSTVFGRVVFWRERIGQWVLF